MRTYGVMTTTTHKLHLMLFRDKNEESYIPGIANQIAGIFIAKLRTNKDVHVHVLYLSGRTAVAPLGDELGEHAERTAAAGTTQTTVARQLQVRHAHVHLWHTHTPQLP